MAFALFLIRETTMHYIEDGTATGKFAIPVSSGDLKKLISSQSKI